MRFEWNTVTLIPIISQLPSATLTLGCPHWSVLGERRLQRAFPLSLEELCFAQQPSCRRPSVFQPSPVSDDRVGAAAV